MTDQPNAWISQPAPPARPTEIFVPVRIGVTPTSFYDGRGNGWQADIYVQLGDEYAGVNCDHCHHSADEAFACGEQLARDLARATIAQLAR